MSGTDRVLEAIDGERIASILGELVRRPSQNPTETEEEVARYVVEFCGRLGLETLLQEVVSGRPNALAWLRGAEAGETLVFTTHMDTVPVGEGWTRNPFGGSVEDGRVYGRGAADAKGALACFLAAMEALKSGGARLRGQVLLAAVVDEETASLGTRGLVQDLRCRYVIVGEPTLGRLGIAHRGSLRPVVVVEGVTAHSSRPHEGVNAVFRAAGLLRAIEQYGISLSARTHPLCGSPTCAVTLISGGIKDNMIPDRCEITVDRRLVPGEAEEEALREVEAVLAEAARGDPALRARVDRFLPTSGGPSEIPRGDPLVGMALRAGARALGGEPEIYGLSVACDMVHFRAIGASALVLGPGWEGVAHKPDEYVEIGQLEGVARAYASIALEALGVDR